MTQCHREDELLDALERGCVGPELDSHVASCAACSELRTVAGALLDENTTAIAESHVPSAGAMLFRLRLRVRQDAEASARRALVVGQLATVIVAVSLLVIYFGRETASLLTRLGSYRASTPLLMIAAVALGAAAMLTQRNRRRAHR